jgi:hypothetical protein
MAARADLFTTIHKGLRSMIYDLSKRLQTTDFANPRSTARLVKDLEYDFAVAQASGCTLCALHNHASDEDSYIFTQTANAAADLTRSLIQEHHELTRQEFAIAKAAHELMALSSPEDRIKSGVRLNQSANELFAAYMAHMNREETELVPVMWDHFTDAQMAEMRGKIIAQFPPDRLFALLGFMLPSLNVTELSGLLASVRPSLPPPVLARIVALCDAQVDPAIWAETRVRAGL